MKTEQQTNTAHQPKKSRLGGIILCFLFALLALALAVGAYLYTNTPPLNMDAFSYVQNSVILDKSGESYQALQGTELREATTITEIPPILRSAFIAIEDKRFYQHSGVDARGLGRALLGVASTGNLDGVGGSTITQQLIKLTQLSSERSIQRKFSEIILATRLEKVWTKDQILEAYLNKINLGGVYGVCAASNMYFDKEPKDLDTAQCCVLAAIAKSPVYYDPYSYDQNGSVIRSADGSIRLSDENRARAGIVLSELLSQGYIDEAAYQDAKASLDANAGLTYVNLTPTYSYFTDAVYEEVLNDLMDKYGYSANEAADYLQTAGLKIYSTVDPSLQGVLEENAEDNTLFPSQSWQAYEVSNLTGKDYIPQVGMTLIDNETGAVSGIVGGRGEKQSLSINRARRPFPTGSTTKPITAYGPGLDTGKITLATVYNDTKISWNGWRPNNATETYEGPMSVRQALAQSVNTVAAQVVAETGISTCADYAKKLGLILDAEDTDGGAALALGGYHTGQTSVDMSAAYAALARGGKYVKPYFYTKVVDREGQVILEKEPEEERVFQEETCYLLTQAMKDVISGGSTNISSSKTELAGKTGTTDNNVHAWFCGYSPDYSLSVWYGYDENLVQTDQGDYSLEIGIFGGDKPGPAGMFEAVMNDLPVKNSTFKKPAGIVEVEIDRASGKLPTELTELDVRGSQKGKEYFSTNNQPREKDDLHKEADVCSSSKLLSQDGCESERGAVLDLSKIRKVAGIEYEGDYGKLEAYKEGAVQTCDGNHSTAPPFSTGSSLSLSTGETREVIVSTQDPLKELYLTGDSVRGSIQGSSATLTGIKKGEAVLTAKTDSQTYTLQITVQ